MSEKIDVLKAEQKVILNEMRSIIAKAESEKRDLTADEQTKYAELNLNAETKNAEVVRHGDERRTSVAARAAIEALKNSGGDFFGADASNKAMEWRDASGNVVPVYTDLKQKFANRYSESRNLHIGRAIRAMIIGDWKEAPEEQRVLSTNGSPGNLLVSNSLFPDLIDRARANAVIFPAGAGVVEMTTKTLDLARVTNDPTIEVKAENDAFSGSDIGLERVQLSAYTLGATCTISRELAQDAINGPEMIMNSLAKAMAVAIDYYALFGAGTTQPLGLANATGVQSVTAVGAITDYSELIQAWTKVLTANGDPNAYILSPRDAGTLEGILTANGQYLQPPAGIAKLNRFITSALPVNGGTGHNDSTAFLGDFRKILIGVRNNLTLEVSQDAGGAFDNHQVKVKATWRGDVAFTQPSHFTKLTGITP